MCKLIKLEITRMLGGLIHENSALINACHIIRLRKSRVYEDVKEPSNWRYYIEYVGSDGDVEITKSDYERIIKELEGVSYV